MPHNPGQARMRRRRKPAIKVPTPGDPEDGAWIKEPGVGLNILLVYPGNYRSGASNLGLQALYRLANNRKRTVAERAFHVTQKPRSLETGRDLAKFHVIAFSIPFEQGLFEMVDVLERASIPASPRERNSRHPLVIAGGIAPTMNPEPYLAVADLVGIGEGEELLPQLLDVMEDDPRASRADKLDAMRELPGWLAWDAPAHDRVERLFVTDWNRSHVPAATVVACPAAEMGRMALVEVARGCTRGCRFCATGYVCRPPRFWPIQVLEPEIKRLAAMSSSIGLVASDLSDHPDLEAVLDLVEDLGCRASPASLRADRAKPELLEKLGRRHQLRTLTLAPEVGDQGLRRTVNKDMDDQVLVDAAYASGLAGIPNLKLYFILGLPGQSRADLKAIADLVERMSRARERGAGGKGGTGMTHVSLSMFVPKPGTPFQWMPMIHPREFKQWVRECRKLLGKVGGVRVSSEPAKSAMVQALISRGDRLVGEVVLESVRAGIDLAGALGGKGLSVEDMALGARDRNQLQPWHRIEHGPGLDALKKELELFERGKPSRPCNPGGPCRRCGLSESKFCLGPVANRR